MQRSVAKAAMAAITDEARCTHDGEGYYEGRAAVFTKRVGNCKTCRKNT